MNLAAEKARAAARCRELAERLTEAERDDLIRAWTRTQDEADAAHSDGAAERVLAEFRKEIDSRLSACGHAFRLRRFCGASSARFASVRVRGRRARPEQDSGQSARAMPARRGRLRRVERPGSPPPRWHPLTHTKTTHERGMVLDDHSNATKEDHREFRAKPIGAKREKVYAALQDVKRERDEHDAETQRLRAEFTSIVTSTPSNTRARPSGPRTERRQPSRARRSSDVWGSPIPTRRRSTRH